MNTMLYLSRKKLLGVWCLDAISMYVNLLIFYMKKHFSQWFIILHAQDKSLCIKQQVYPYYKHLIYIGGICLSFWQVDLRILPRLQFMFHITYPEDRIIDSCGSPNMDALTHWANLLTHLTLCVWRIAYWHGNWI